MNLGFRARSALCPSDAEKAAGVHDHRCLDPGARHWREHGDLQRRQCTPVAPITLSAFRADCSAERTL